MPRRGAALKLTMVPRAVTLTNHMCPVQKSWRSFSTFNLRRIRPQMETWRRVVVILKPCWLTRKPLEKICHVSNLRFQRGRLILVSTLPQSPLKWPSACSPLPWSSTWTPRKTLSYLSLSVISSSLSNFTPFRDRRLIFYRKINCIAGKWRYRPSIIVWIAGVLSFSSGIFKP